MKLIDKYLLREYLVPLLCCLLGFCVLYIISGLFDKAADFVRAGVTLGQIFYFYGLYLVAYADQSNVSFLVTILPVSLLAAALYSLTRLTRQNEITAMCASGISVVRLMVPYLGVGLVCSVAAVAIQEFVAPRASRLTDVFLAEHGKQMASPVVTSGRYYDIRDGCLWHVSKVDLSEPTTLTGVELKREFLAESRKASAVTPYERYEVVVTNIVRAEWRGDRWLFFGAIEQKYRRDGAPDGPPVCLGAGPVELPEFRATPRDIAFGIDSVKSQKYVSASVVLNWLNSRYPWSGEDVMQVVDTHRRLAMPWACMIAVMLAIPAGVKGGREGVISGMLLALALFIGFYFTLEAAMVLGKKQQFLEMSWLGAWFANIVFFLIGTVMIRRVQN